MSPKEKEGKQNDTETTNWRATILSGVIIVVSFVSTILVIASIMSVCSH
jgi:uncharacterized membrane protein